METTNERVFYYKSQMETFKANLKEKAAKGLISNYKIINDSDRSCEKYIVTWR